MLWFKAQQTDHLICMETTVVDSYAFHTVLDPGFFLHKMKRDSMPHNHLNHELYFIEAGTCTAKCGKDVLVCTQGDLLLIPIGVEHNVHTLSEDASLYSLRFSCPMLKMPQAPTILHSQRTAKLLSMLRDELACLRPYTLEGVKGLLQMFYAELLHLLFYPEQDVPKPGAKSIVYSPEQLRKMPGYQMSIPQEYYIDMLDEFFTHLPAEAPTLSELADRLHLSISQTKRLIKAKYGISFQQKLIQTRMEQSKHLMQTTALSLEQIAESVGYHSYNTFFDIFCEHTGKTPSQYRKENT